MAKYDHEYVYPFREFIHDLLYALMLGCALALLITILYNLTQVSKENDMSKVVLPDEVTVAVEKYMEENSYSSYAVFDFVEHDAEILYVVSFDGNEEQLASFVYTTDGTVTTYEMVDKE